MGVLDKLFGDTSSKKIKKIQPLVKRINDLEAEIGELSNEDLRSKTNEFKLRLKSGETLDDLLPEAFAVVREAAKRTAGMRHFDVQLIGGIVMHNKGIAEMRTGEGKTLVATLPLYLNALSGKGSHLVTVNDYLAKRDAVWMAQVYDFLGLSVGILVHGGAFLYDGSGNDSLDERRDKIASFKVLDEFLRPAERKEAYAADITYGANSEFGFDYLRDHLAYEEEGIRQRGFNFAVVDEIDSILIDEARTPLIISAPTQDSESLYSTFAGIVADFKEGEDYEVEEKHRQVILSDKGIEKAEKALGVDNIYTDKGIKYVHHLETGVRAKALFKKDKQYVIQDGQAVIIDEFTGRTMSGRRFSEGLHQAIEAKEGVEIRQESRTFASITYQNFFRLYEKLAGMTGTAETSAEEFYRVYGLDVVVIPTNKEIARIDNDDLIFQTEKGKFKAIAKKIKEINTKGQPILVGTVSVETNEMLSEFLKKEGIAHEILNAKNHEREGEIIAQAGRKGAVTVATNMAGRGVDIKLGGNPTTQEEQEEIKKLGGLFVLGTERHDARRIDNQLRGRSGRQGDPGETQFFVSLEDKLMRIFASDTIKNMMGRFGIPEDEAIQNKMITRALESAQTKIEGHHFDARKWVLQFDDVLNEQRRVVYERRQNVLFGDADYLRGYIEGLFDGASPEEVKKLEEKLTYLDNPQFITVLKRIVLRTIDLFWVDHLEAMDYMRSSVNLRAYGQRDPLTEYKKEGLVLFKQMEQSVFNEVRGIVVKIDPQSEVRVEREEGQEVQNQAQKLSKQGLNTSSSSVKIGRNDRVVITKGGKDLEMKFKKAEGLLAEGWKIKEVKEE